MGKFCKYTTQLSRYPFRRFESHKINQTRVTECKARLGLKPVD